MWIEKKLGIEKGLRENLVGHRIIPYCVHDLNTFYQVLRVWNETQPV